MFECPTRHHDWCGGYEGGLAPGRKENHRPGGQHARHIWMLIWINHFYQIWIIGMNGLCFVGRQITTAATEKPARQPACCILQNDHSPHSDRHIIQSPRAATSLNSRIKPTSGHSSPANVAPYLTRRPHPSQPTNQMDEWICA